MKVYPKYKPSGIDWLGEIPETWEVWKAKFLCKKVATGNTPSSNELKYYENGEIDWFTPGDFGNDFTMINSQRKVTKIAVEEKKCELFNPFSTFVIGIVATLGKVRISKVIASANQQINVLEFNDKILPKFVFSTFIRLKIQLLLMQIFQRWALLIKQK